MKPIKQMALLLPLFLLMDCAQRRNAYLFGSVPGVSEGILGASGGEEADPVLSRTDSTVSIDSNEIGVGAPATLTITLVDEDGEAMTGKDLSFSISGGGGGDGEFSEATDNDDGTYTATLTGTGVGTQSNDITVFVDGVSLTSTMPYVTIYPGRYTRVLTLSSVTPRDDTTVRVELTPGNFNNYTNVLSGSGDDIRFFAGANNAACDFYLESYDNTGTSVFYVKVPQAGTGSLKIAYGTPGVSAASNMLDTFSFNSSTNAYYVMRAEGDSMSVSSYADSNTVRVTTGSGTSSKSFDQYSNEDFFDVLTGWISVFAPIIARVTSDAGFETVAPLSFQATQTGFVNSQGVDTWIVFNPNSSSASVTIYDYDGAGVLQGSNTTVVSSNSREVIEDDVDTYGLLESTKSVIVEYLAGSESALLAQSSTEWLGVVSGSAYLGATTNGTNVTVNYDTSASDCAGPFNRGERCSLSGGNTAGDGEAAYLVADQPIVVHAQDDGDGGEAVMFMPVNELSTEYVIPVDAEYIALASLNTHAVVVCEPGEIYPVECDAIALASDGTTPDKAKASGAPVLAAGTRVLSDEPFYAYYEYATMDESIALGPKQGRLNMVPPPTIGIAAEVEEFTP